MLLAKDSDKSYNYYAPKIEGGNAYNDPELKI